MMKMLAKDPKQRISTGEALNHQWIQAGGIFQSPRTMAPIYLNTAQENMRRFQEENRFNVKNIKQKDQIMEMERSGHAPSPLINGRVVTVADSKNHFFLNSPDIRKPGMMANYDKFVGNKSSPNDSQASTKSSGSDNGVMADEISFLNVNLSGYTHEGTLLSQINQPGKSAHSSVHSTPTVDKRPINPKPNAKKALNIQGNLLKFIGGAPPQKPVEDKQQHQEQDVINNK